MDSSEAKRLKSERALLKRTLINEKEKVAELQEQLRAKESEAQSLLMKSDSLADEKSHLSKMVAKLKKDLQTEQQASTVNLQGGSMFSSFMSSADGTAGEITRLQREVSVLQEELTAQMQNTSSAHSTLNSAKEKHRHDLDKLKKRAHDAMKECETLTSQMENMQSDLDFVKRERTEIKTQLSSKSALVSELSSKLKSKAEALRYVEELRVSDLKALQGKYDAKVPFDDTVNTDANSLLEMRPRIFASAQSLFECQERITQSLKHLCSWLSLWLAVCRETEVETSLCSAILSLSTNCTNLYKMSATQIKVARIPFTCRKRQEAKQNVLKLFQRVAASFESLVLLVDTSDTSSLILNKFKEARPLIADIASQIGSSVQTESLVGIFSDIARLMTNVDDTLATKKYSLSDVFSGMAQAIHEYIIRIRSLRNDKPLMSNARKYLSQLNQMDIQSHEEDSTSDKAIEQQLKHLQERCNAQASKMVKMEAQHHEVRLELTTKEKQLAESQRFSSHRTSESIQIGDPVDDYNYGDECELVVLDTRDGSLSSKLSLQDKYVADETTKNSLIVEQLDSLLMKLRAAESNVVTLTEQYNEANSRLASLSEEKKHQNLKIKSYEVQLSQFEKKAQEEIKVTRENYDVQLQQLTMHLMRLQDTEQEYEVEVNRLRNLLKKIETDKKEEEYNVDEATTSFLTSNPFL